VSNELEFPITLFPNPMTSSAILEVGKLNGPSTLEVHDMNGKRVRLEQRILSQGLLNLDRGQLSSGTYLLRLITEYNVLDISFIVK